MEIDRDRIVELIWKFRLHTLQEEETLELKKWVETGDHLRIFERLLDQEHEMMFLSQLKKYDSQYAYKNFKARINISRKRIRYYWQIAAMFVLPLAIGAWLYWWNGQYDTAGDVDRMEMSVLSPVGKKAILTLADGTQLPINEQADEIISEADSRLKLDSTGLVYERKTAGQELRMNEVYVPQTGEFKLMLSDGTRVYLNSDTRLTYPVIFGSGKREVFLKGEAYFEVTPDTNRQFIVRTDKMDIRVLGTSFNINAYPDASRILATLTSGKIRAVCKGKEYDLVKGQQICSDMSTGETKVEMVNTEIYTCWKDGYYYFEEARLEDIMRILSRWYGISTFYVNPSLKNLEFTGRLHRYENVEIVLRKFEQAININFSVKGNTVTVQAR